MSHGLYEHEPCTEDEISLGARQAFSRLLPILKTQRKRLAVCFFLLAAGTGLSLYWPILLKMAIDGPLETNDFNGLMKLAAAICMFQIFTVIFQYFLRVKLETIGQDMLLELKRRMYRHILKLDISFFEKHPVGRLMARVESDSESLRQLFTNTVLLVLTDFLMLAGIYSVLFYYNWKMTLVLVGVLPVIVVAMWIFHRLTTHRFLELRKRMAELTSVITEFLHGMSLIQVFNRGAYASRKVLAANNAKRNMDNYVNVGMCIFFNFVFFFEYVKIGLVLLFGTLFGLTAGLVVLFLVSIWRSFEPVFRASEQLANLQKGVAGAKRIFALLEKKALVVDHAEPVEWPGLKECISFENIWFSYDGEDSWVLKDVSFDLKAGQRVALVGVTGGGKTTVISLLLRLYDPQKGRITVDGVDVRCIPRDVLRKKFALVLQDVILFPGTVSENISLESEDVTHEQISRAAKTVAADKFIDRLEKGYDTEVSEKGANFSRGERQLLSFARALVADPEILVLDEATSSVDPHTERTIQKSLRALTADRTSLIIAHRLSTVLDADRILVVRHGKIVEQGSHEDLMGKNGYYASLFRFQFQEGTKKDGRKGEARNVQ